MATALKNFSLNTQLSTAAADIVTAADANTVKSIKKLSFRNTGSSTRTVTVYMVQSGGSAATANELAVKAIAPGKEWNVILAQGENLESGQKLQAKQDAGADVNANCSGFIDS